MRGAARPGARLGEQEGYFRLSQLVGERGRLEKQLSDVEEKGARIRKRLVEIDREVSRTEARVGRVGDALELDSFGSFGSVSVRKGWDEVELRY